MGEAQRKWYAKYGREYAKRRYALHKEEINAYKVRWARENLIQTKDRKYHRAKKQPRLDNRCELCDKPNKLLHYHHWNDKHTEFGIWVCPQCHNFVGLVEQGYHIRYSFLKELVESMPLS